MKTYSLKTARASRAVGRPPLSLEQRKAEFVTWIKERFFLRFHMAVILGLTFLAGLAVTKLLLVAGNTNLALRYGVAVAASYLAFLLVLKLWLLYIEGGQTDDAERALDVADAVDGLVDAVGRIPSPGAHGARGFHSAGGGYGGGGGSASFGESEGSGAASLVSDDGEGFGLVVLAAVVLIGLALAGGYLIYAGPTILAEAAFEALLASALIPGARKADAEGWMRPVVRATVAPFLLMLALAVGFGWVAADLCPEARRVVDVMACAGS